MTLHQCATRTGENDTTLTCVEDILCETLRFIMMWLLVWKSNYALMGFVIADKLLILNEDWCFYSNEIDF